MLSPNWTTSCLNSTFVREGNWAIGSLDFFTFWCLSVYLSICLSVYFSLYPLLYHNLKSRPAFCLEVQLSISLWIVPLWLVRYFVWNCVLLLLLSSSSKVSLNEFLVLLIYLVLIFSHIMNIFCLSVFLPLWTSVWNVLSFRSGLIFFFSHECVL